ncbi:hypothetical protein AAY473_010837, partial [Plecturocebus cupreus]
MIGHTKKHCVQHWVLHEGSDGAAQHPECIWAPGEAKVLRRPRQKNCLNLEGKRCEMQSCYVAQAGLKLLASGDPPTPAFQRVMVIYLGKHRLEQETVIFQEKRKISIKDK